MRNKYIKTSIKTDGERSNGIWEKTKKNINRESFLRSKSSIYQTLNNYTSFFNLLF